MSKERARRRAEREREAAIVAAARAAEAERKERRDARFRALTGWVPRRRRRPGGIIAERRRRQTGVLLAMLVFVNVVVWLASPDWALRVGVLLLSVLTAPVLYTMLFRRT